MARCIFCDAEIGQKNSPEHIMLDAFGGKKKCYGAICRHCNLVFGRTIDDEFAKQTIDIRNMFKMGRGSDGSVPNLSRIEIGNQILNVKGDGTLELANRKPFDIKYGPNGLVNIQMIGNTLQEINKSIKNVARVLKINENDLRDKMTTAAATETWERPGVRNLALSFGGSSAIRSATKALIVLWSTIVGNEEIRSTAYEAARSFVSIDCDYFREKFTHLDARLVPTINPVSDTYGPLFNMLWVTSDHSGKVIGHYTINNLIGFQVTLAFGGGSPNKQAILINDPMNPSNWTDTVAEEFIISIRWLETPKYFEILDIAKARIYFMMSLYEPLMLPSVLGSISDQACMKYGYKKDDVVAPKDVEAIMKEADLRILKHINSEIHTENVPADVLREIFGRKKGE